MTFWRLYYPLTWATKERQLLISVQIEPRLYGYLIRKAAELEVYVYAINGWADHVHIVVAIPPKLAPAEVVKSLKGASSHDLNHEAGLDYTFMWQRGYGALSLGEKQRPVAIQYVLDQKIHHQNQSANLWLERWAEVDEGPEDTGVQLKSVPSLVSDECAGYRVMGESPF